jgi:hypothetical protein
VHCGSLKRTCFIPSWCRDSARHEPLHGRVSGPHKVLLLYRPAHLPRSASRCPCWLPLYTPWSCGHSSTRTAAEPQARGTRPPTPPLAGTMRHAGIGTDQSSYSSASKVRDRIVRWQANERHIAALYAEYFVSNFSGAAICSPSGACETADLPAWC